MSGPRDGVRRHAAPNGAWFRPCSLAINMALLAELPRNNLRANLSVVWPILRPSEAGKPKPKTLYPLRSLIHHLYLRPGTRFEVDDLLRGILPIGAGGIGPAGDAVLAGRHVVELECAIVFHRRAAAPGADL